MECRAALPPEIAQLLRHVALLPAETAVRDLVEAADLHGPVEVDETTAADVLHRYMWLLHRVGDGLTLTAAGWLPPAVVTEAMGALWPEDRWIGKRNREDLTEPVRRLRASAQRLGLLRVNRGVAARDQDGHRGAERPRPAVAARRRAALGEPKDIFARTATALLLVSAAAGRIDGDQLAAVMMAAGWSARDGSGVHRYAVTSAAGHVDEVLDVVGAYQGRRQLRSAGHVLARAALRSR